MQELTENVQSPCSQTSLKTEYRRFHVFWKQGGDRNASMSSTIKGCKHLSRGIGVPHYYHKRLIRKTKHMIMVLY